jgi:hypothetical protein
LIVVAEIFRGQNYPPNKGLTGSFRQRAITFIPNPFCEKKAMIWYQKSGNLSKSPFGITKDKHGRITTCRRLD